MTKTIKLRNVATSVVVFLMALAIALPGVVGAQGNGQGGQPEEVAARVAERKEKAQERIEEKRLTMESKTEERRQAACERNVNKLNSSMDRIASQANRILGVMDSFKEKVEGFYSNGQLTVPGYDSLLADVETAQDAAVIEIEALSELNVEIDCTDPEVVLGVSAFKGSADAAKTVLKEYRKTLVTLISNMRAEAAQQSSAVGETESETEDESESEDETETEVETETETETGTETETEDVTENDDSNQEATQ